MLAEQNVETINATGVKKVVTSCPHCLHTLRHDYPQWGGDWEVVHHTQLIDHLIKAGKLEVGGSPAERVTYHDSCYLGRWNKEFDAPRAVINALAPPGGLTELTRNKRHGFCCGAGGGRMFMEESLGTRINHNRIAEAAATGAAEVCTACPFCLTMLGDAIKETDRSEQLRARDIAEVLLDNLA